MRYRAKSLHPFEVEACLLNSCNLHCVYCRCPDSSTVQMTTDEWVRIIRHFSRLGTLRFKLHGGEPTLRPDFRTLCAESRNAGMITAAVTNGLTVPACPELLDDLDELIISLDSPAQATNDRTRGHGSFEAAMATMSLAQERGVRTYVNMVLTRHNLADLEAMLDFCETRGVGFNAQPVIFGRGPYSDLIEELALSEDEIRKLHQRLLAWKRQGRRQLFSTEAYRRALEWPEDYSVLTRRSEGGPPCVAGRDYVRIEANGDVVPCCQFEADFTPQNLLRDGLEEALRHVQTHNCGNCWFPYYTERMALFRLRPAAVWNTLRHG